MNLSIYDAMTLISLKQSERIKILSLSPEFEQGFINYTSEDGRHRLITTPGRFIKRHVPHLSSSEVKMFAELLCKPTTVVITNDLESVKKAYSYIKSCMSYHTELLSIYLDAGLSLAISYLGDKIIGRMLVDTNSKKCNTGYGNFNYLSRYLLKEGYTFSEDWLEGVSFSPISEGHMYLMPWLDTPSKLKLVDDKFVVSSSDGIYEIHAETHRVFVR